MKDTEPGSEGRHSDNEASVSITSAYKEGHLTSAMKQFLVVRPGFVKDADCAKACGLSVQTVYDWKWKSPAYVEAYNEVMERARDYHNAAARAIIDDSKSTAATYLHKAIGHSLEKFDELDHRDKKEARLVATTILSDGVIVQHTKSDTPPIQILNIGDITMAKSSHSIRQRIQDLLPSSGVIHGERS